MVFGSRRRQIHIIVTVPDVTVTDSWVGDLGLIRCGFGGPPDTAMTGCFSRVVSPAVCGRGNRKRVSEHHA
jgi:hypothetical protein